VLLAISKTWIVLRAKLLLEDAAGRTTVIYKMLWAELLLQDTSEQNYCYVQDASEQNYCYKMLPNRTTVTYTFRKA